MTCANDEYYFKVENENIRWCDNNSCQIVLSLIEDNPVIDCVKETVISDNRNDWFTNSGLSPINIPQFRYCDVIKPTFFYGALITFVNMIDSTIAVLNGILTLLDGIMQGINAILGTNYYVPTIPYVVTQFIGCNRTHPSPFIRDYIDNVCNICGIFHDNTSDPIFSEPFKTIDGSTYDNEYYYATLMNAPARKGLKLSEFWKFYIQSNRPSYTLDAFLSKIKDIWNARYFIYNGYLYFDRKDMIGERVYGAGVQLDLTSSTIAHKVIQDPCYTYNGQGKPKRINLNWGIDAIDSIGNEARKRFNGEYIEPGNNPNFKELLQKEFYEFGVGSFVLDGIDSEHDAITDRAIGSVLMGSPFTGCIKMMRDENALPKILIYDTTTPNNDARVIPSPYDNYGSAGADIDAFKDDDANYFPINSSDCYNYNYPISFDPQANGIGNRYNLWEFHKIDAPNNNKISNTSFEFKLYYCCEFNYLNLYMKVKLNDNFTGEINYLLFDHDKREITVKGNLI